MKRLLDTIAFNIQSKDNCLFTLYFWYLCVVNFLLRRRKKSDRVIRARLEQELERQRRRFRCSSHRINMPLSAMNYCSYSPLDGLLKYGLSIT
ncbi:MAG TPA: hypothetical protein PKY85_05300, partial [Nitrosomonas sp.]|nr:hypothetical protein [Nitrosomonas sp.]